MEFSALDSGKLLALMVAGGLFALAGLWLMFRPKAEGSSAKIELFGMKFESSSAGLLVFLIGAAFLALPVVVPERAPENQPVDSAIHPNGQDVTYLSADEIEVLLSGNTASGTWGDLSYRQYFAPDGTTRWIDGDGNRSSGRWAANRDTDTYESWWADGSHNTYPMGRIGSEYFSLDGTTKHPFVVIEGERLE